MRLQQHLQFLTLSGLLTASTLGADLPVLNLADAVGRALNRRAAIPAAEARLRGTEGLTAQARAHPNPAFTFQMENWRFGGSPEFQPADDVDYFAYLSQRIETGGKRARRTDVGKQNTGLAALELRLLKWNIRQEVRRAYYRALLAQKQLQLTTENNESFQQIVEYHRFRVREGAMAEADLVKVELEASRQGLELENRALEGERSRFDLLKTMGESSMTAHFQLADPGMILLPGVSTPAPAAVVKSTLDSSARPPALTSSTAAGSLEALLQVARQERLEVLFSHAMVEAARAKLSLDQSQAHPDWSVLWGYKRTAGFNTLMAGISVPLPFFDRNQGAIASGSSELERAQSLLRATLADV